MAGRVVVNIPFWCRVQSCSLITIVAPASMVQSFTLQSGQSIAGGRSRVSREGSDPRESDSEKVGELIVKDRMR